jgi:hypothetical protein
MYFFDLDKFHFNCDGYYNSKQSWLSDDTQIKIIWDTTLTPNCWRFSSTTYYWFDTIINTNPATPPINGNWTWVGRDYEITATQGECPVTEELEMTVVKNNPSCECDANITVYGQGGQPPYQYSFDNGVTYGNSPFKNGLCGDLSLTVKIQDSIGTVVSQLVQIPPQTESVVYTFKFETLSTTVISQSQPAEILYEYGITVDPPLPNGVTITFSLNAIGRFTRTPSINSATGTITPLVIKNGVTLTNINNTTNTSNSNPRSGCQNYTIFTTNYEYLYNNLTYTNTDVYVIKLTSYLLGSCQSSPSSTQSLSENGENTLGPLGYGIGAANSYLNCCDYVMDLVGILNTSTEISNCDCCSLGATYTKSLYE